MDVQHEFWRRLKDEWLAAFCSAHGYDPKGFRPDAKLVTDVDARDFLRAVDQKLVSVDERNRFRAPQSKAYEHIFYEHPPKGPLRPITLWIEPIITIAAIARLHLDFGWPIECLGMQSVAWSFDLIAFRPDDLTNELIAGEVKATSNELDKFLAHLHECCAEGEHNCATAKPVRRNAHKKWKGLKRCHAPLFWALGPGGDSRVFDVLYNEDGTIELNRTAEERLRFS